MKEEFNFLPIKNKLDKKKEEKAIKPITDNSEKEISHKDYFLSLRQSIQEFTKSEKEDKLEDERIKMLKELISPELILKYKKILGQFRDKSSKTNVHPEREFIDINEEEIEVLIEEWVLELKNEIEKKSGSLNEEDFEELEAECWLFFDTLSTSMNTKSIERDINSYVEKNNIDIEDDDEYKRSKKELSQMLQDKYPLKKVELDVLVDMVARENFDEYNIQKVIATLSDIYNNYDLRNVRKEAMKTVAGYLATAGIKAVGPFFLQGVGNPEPDKNIASMLGFFGSLSISNGINTKVELIKLEVLKHLDLEINKRITNSLFFQEFEFVHEKSLGEIYTTLERGKDSVNEMVDSTMEDVVPIAFGSVASLGLLTKINPILGAIGVGSIPIMHHIAKNQNKKISPIYRKEMEEQETATKAIGAMKSGFEEIRTSSDITDVAEDTKKHLNTKDESMYKRKKKETVMNYKRMIPNEISGFVALGVGYLLQQKGLISPGAILTNVIYSSQLTQPIKQLVDIYYNRYPRQIQDIERMEEMLGKYEKLDLPEGEKEEERIPVSELKNFDITIKNLSYKNILKNLDLEIKEGEFATIAGPSGAGKSTLLRNMIGLFEPEKGGVKIGGTKVDDIKKYGHESIFSAMSYCNQSPQIFPEMTLRENLLLWNKGGDTNDEKIIKVLEDLHLDKFISELDKNLKHASGGEKVRIGLARTLLKNPKVMLLDEPTASLDSRARLEVLNVIEEIKKNYPDRTIICVSHDDELIEMGDKKINISEIQNNK
ncbi:ABC transporter ATP-binding protein [Candidatus Parcubacteria bacterium]|nr:ABC transporter ATP-binding protein [Candidatus Parcubacteria bacterium]